MADRESRRNLVGAPETFTSPVLTLVNKPIVVTLVDDMALRRIERRGTDAAIEFAPEINHRRLQLGWLDIRLVSRCSEFLAGNSCKYPLVANTHLRFVDADILVASRLPERRMVFGRPAIFRDFSFVELVHFLGIFLAEKLADVTQDSFRVADQFFVIDVHPLV